MSDTAANPKIALIYDRAINYAFQQNAIPVVKELRIQNCGTPRKALTVRITTDPPFAAPLELHLQSLEADQEFRAAPLDLKLSPDFLAGLNEKVTGWLRAEVIEGETILFSITEPITLLARNEWCGLVSLPEILAAFILPNDPAVMPLLGRASEILGAHTGRAALNGYQDKSRKRAWEQVAAIYKAIAEQELRYINPPASFENTGQKVRFPSDMIGQRFGTCLDLALLFAACCEQIGLHPLILMHEGHAYAGCWLEDKTLEEPVTDDLQRIRKLATDELLTVFETTVVAGESACTFRDAEKLAQPHLEVLVPFRMALDIRRARIARIHPLPIPGQKISAMASISDSKVTPDLGSRDFTTIIETQQTQVNQPVTRIDQWKSRLLDLSLRNRLLNFKPTKTTIPILSASPEHVEDELAAGIELSMQPRPKLMGDDDPRHANTYSRQQKSDALAEHLRDELKHRRLHTGLDESEHARRLTELYRATRLALEENGTNTLFAAVGILEWRETEHSDRVLRAPLLLVPVELKRKSVIEGFALRRIDEETRLNVTLMEMLRQQFQKEVPGLDPLPEDEKGVNVARVFQIFREAVRDLPGWEVKAEVWLGQFSFTKFLLWKDLADRLDELTRNRIVNHLVHEAGLPYPNPPEDIRPAQLDDQFHPRDIFCPRSADSSQLAAVMAAAAGHDFVLEGPPGTGKSQTITNIIAHCLAQGKRVLFVAEKRAALDVVHRRLHEDGLAPFCLELHSNKTGKGDVLAQFDQSLKFLANTALPDWEQRSIELEKLRAELNGYTRALHRRYPCGLSAYQCFDYLLPRQNEATVRLDDWKSILETSAETLERSRELSRRLQERAQPLGTLADHVLKPLACEEWSPAWAERMLASVQQLGAITKAADEATRDLRNWLRLPDAPVSRVELSRLGELVDCLLKPEPVGPAFATTPWNQLVADLDQWIALARERVELREKLADLLEERSQTNDDSFIRLACERWSSEDAERNFKRIREVEIFTQAAIESSRDVRTWLRRPSSTASRVELDRVSALVESLLVIEPVSPAFVTTPWNELAVYLDGWIALVRERANLRTKLADYDEVALLALDLDALRERWQSAQSAWFLIKWFCSDSIRRQLRSARRDKTKPEAVTIADVLQSAVRLRALNVAFAGNTPTAENYIASLWAKGEPDINALILVRAWGDLLNERMVACASDDLKWLSQFRELVANLLREGSAAYASGTANNKRLSRFREDMARFNPAMEMLVADVRLRRDLLNHATDYFSTTATILSKFLITGLRLRSINTDFSTAEFSAQACLGMLWKKGEPSVVMLEKARAWGKNLHASLIACANSDIAWLAQARQLLAPLFGEGPESYAPETAIGERFKRYCDTLVTFYKTFDVFATEMRLERGQIDATTDYLPSILALTNRLPGAWSQLRHWCSWQKVRQEAQTLSLAPIIEKLEASDGRTVDLPAFFERSFRRALLFAAIEKESSLREFFGHEHSDRIARFGQLDEKLATLSRDLIQARLAAEIPRDNVQDDIPKAELGLLRKEIGKKMRHIPVRQLLSRIPRLLPRLKPCVLMSPLSVAQYLDASHESFDIVIFDEASQIPVWDAVGAIARGKQLIVVGDPKQLPPTNFFNSSSDGDEDIPEEHQDLESILDELLTHGLRHKRLQWHYRSRHEGLIAFSNRHYYENDLLTFPSPETELGGVRFKHLPEARYDKGKSRTNPAEAKALVDELVRRLRIVDGPHRSFGVVTFSQAQQQLVENLLDEERRKYPEIEIHFADESPVEGEPVFVKNLESVQGDERDVILFSICYGPDESGRISMNFGPLNREGGERRLNVAITRAKHELLIFSGLRGDQIDLTRTRARGVRDLKYFLDYAERGPKALIAATSASAAVEADSEFERMVADRIRKAGYEVHYQVGCSGYRIDLGIVDPKAPGHYILGVECDGATYHRAATARDRDKLRQLILEGVRLELAPHLVNRLVARCGKRNAETTFIFEGYDEAMNPYEEHLLQISRRQFFKRTGFGLGSIALGSLLAETFAQGAPAKTLNPLAARKPQFPAKAKNVIYLHMVGAPSQLDLFDHKPLLEKYDDQLCPQSFIEGKRFAFLRGHPKIASSKYEFSQHGKSGQEISQLLPNLAKISDDIALIKTLHTDEFNHGPAQLFLHTGFGRPGRPSFGSWTTYGLGSENENLPAYVVLLSGGGLPGAGTSLWSNGFLPGIHQGVQFRSSGDPVLFLSNPEGHSRTDRRRMLDAISSLNQQSLSDIGDPEISTRIGQYEMAFRMQTAVPELSDLSKESPETLAMYGAQPGKPSFANNCLLARRLVERGVRLVQLYDSDWDHHSDLATRLPKKCKDVDQPMAALVQDLKQRGLLEDTLVIWGGEFGRTPMQQVTSGEGGATKPGRDHHKDAFTMWMAGGGVKPGITYGKTDDFGYNVAENPVHVHDLNATVLNLLGIDHERLTYKYQGREFRLTDVHGQVVKGLLA